MHDVYGRRNDRLSVHTGEKLLLMDKSLSVTQHWSPVLCTARTSRLENTGTEPTIGMGVFEPQCR